MLHRIRRRTGQRSIGKNKVRNNNDRLERVAKRAKKHQTAAPSPIDEVFPAQAQRPSRKTKKDVQNLARSFVDIHSDLGLLDASVASSVQPSTSGEGGEHVMSRTERGKREGLHARFVSASRAVASTYLFPLLYRSGAHPHTALPISFPFQWVGRRPPYTAAHSSYGLKYLDALAPSPAHQIQTPPSLQARLWPARLSTHSTGALPQP